jgi:hypothetical protein
MIRAVLMPVRARVRMRGFRRTRGLAERGECPKAAALRTRGRGAP